MKRAAGYLLTMILLINFICVYTVQPVFADTENYVVRIGLTSNYEGKSSLTIKNTSVSMGYAVDGTFVENDVFTGNSGFTFTPEGRYCYASVTQYSTYSEVMNAIHSLKVSGDQVLPAITGNATYRIYVTGDSLEAAASMAVSLESSGKIHFEASTCEMSYREKMSWDGGTLLIDVDSRNQYPQFGAATENDKGVYVIDLGERQYRGKIEIGRFGGKSTLTAVSVLDMEEYLYGVIACEMVPSWEMEALKAQALCARSYAYALDKRSVVFGADNGYALYDTTYSQVYRGYGSENERTNQAVDETRGKMIYYRENVIKAYFYSTSGGHTASCEDVWDVPLTYFRGVPDNTELYQEKAPWIVSKSLTEISSALSGKGYSVGSVSSISAQIRADSGRIYQLKVNGSGGSAVLQKEDISSTLSLPSTKVRIIKAGDVPDQIYVQSANQNTQKQISNSYIISGDGAISQASATLEQYIVISEDNLWNYPRTAPLDNNTLYFAGMGYGHGVGLSQSGAQSLALQGYDCESIIHHYYNKVDIR
ncbi:MAG: SpoIID/LytB domain-containing protein [Lachnospiraceae bacterium]